MDMNRPSRAQAIGLGALRPVGDVGRAARPTPGLRRRFERTLMPHLMAVRAPVRSSVEERIGRRSGSHMAGGGHRGERSVNRPATPRVGTHGSGLGSDETASGSPSPRVGARSPARTDRPRCHQRRPRGQGPCGRRSHHHAHRRGSGHRCRRSGRVRVAPRRSLERWRRPHRGPRGLRRAEPLLRVRADHVDDHEGLARAEAEPALQWCTAIRHGQRTDAVSCIAASFFAMCPPLVMASYFGGSSAARHVGSTSMMAS